MRSAKRRRRKRATRRDPSGYGGRPEAVICMVYVGEERREFPLPTWYFVMSVFQRRVNNI
jgi:hypothetical protein